MGLVSQSIDQHGHGDPLSHLGESESPGCISCFPIPLQGDDRAIPIDLKPLVDNLYDLGRYSLRCDYAQAPPEPVLDLADREWCDRVLRDRGLLN